MKVLFIPQNETHISNFEPIIEILSSAGYECTYLDTRNIFHQELKLIDKKYITPGTKLERPFYASSNLSKIKFLIQFKKEAPTISKEFDMVIAGNDGVIQRIFLNKKMKSILIIDGMISNYSFNFKILLKNFNWLNLKQWISFFARYKLIKNIFNPVYRLKLDIFLPSIIGITPCDKIFVIGDHSKQVIRSYNSKSDIISTGLPRFKHLFVKSILTKRSRKAIYFFTSAFKWHGLHDMDIKQHMDLRLLCSLLEKKSHDDLELVIKIHPRETVSDYLRYKDFSFVNIIKDGDINQEFYSNCLYLSNISTAIIEAAKK